MKKIISIFLIIMFIGLETAPVHAFWKIGVNKNVQTKQTKKQDKELYKTIKKKKDISYKKMKVKNKYDYINLAWWESFNDEYLTDYINRAMEHNYDLKMATLTVDEYYQNVKLQMSNELPKLQVGYGLGVAGVPAGMVGKKRKTIHGMGLPIIASYEADIFLKNHDKTTSVKKLFQASIEDERAAYISIISAVGSVYYNIVRLDKTISLQEDIVNLRKNIYELMALSNEQGIVSTSDMIKANKAYILGQSDLIDLEKKRIALLNQLAILIGDSPENIEEFKRISYDEIQYKNIIPENISSDIIVQRPDYLKAEAMVKKAGIDARVAKKEFLPTIDILGLAMFGATHLKSLFTTNKSALWGVAGNLTWPIFTGGARIANLKINKTRLEKALRNYQKTNLVAIQEINDALYIAKSDNQKLNQNKEHLALETKDFGMTEKKYEQGVISKLDLFQMKENLLTIQKLVASNTLDCMIDSISLYKVCGAKF